MHMVVITADAAGFKQKLLSGAPTTITYAGQRSADLLAQDKLIGSYPIRLTDAAIRIMAIDKVFQ